MVSELTRVKRHPERGAYDFESIAAILDEALFCHVGFIDGGRPVVIPTIHARVGKRLYLHGSPLSRMLKTLSAGVDVCLTATILDGLVLARSVFNHSLNYRSTVVMGRARVVGSERERLMALNAIVEHVVPGRSREARAPSPKELRATEVVGLPIRAASAKIRSGPPNDPAADLELPVWAGVIPLRLVAGQPEPDSRDACE
jgi:nitroimidazol reductase NimA-like FMN-containing flavoprotein (pyridoxamine 5'-phosphate oxidase superfamily)